MSRQIIRVTVVAELEPVGPVKRARGEVAHAFKNAIRRAITLVWVAGSGERQTAYRLTNVHIEHSDQVEAPDEETAA